MRTYIIYLIEKQFANHFYGREHMFYNLFYDYEETEGEDKRILRRQIMCVTKRIPASLFSSYMDEKINSKQGCFEENGVYYIRKNRNGAVSEASLGFRNHSLILHASGSYESETIFFEWLRQWNPYFLALDTGEGRCAWLRPIKQPKFILS